MGIDTEEINRQVDGMAILMGNAILANAYSKESNDKAVLGKVISELGNQISEGTLTLIDVREYQKKFVAFIQTEMLEWEKIDA